MSERLPRVGVFLCHCGTNIGGVINLPQVADYTRKLDGVAFVQENLHSCSSEGITRIQEAIKEHDLERVVVSACTPRTHEGLFMNAVEEAGVNKYLFQMVNVREHSSWVHGDTPEEATRKAKQLLQMAVAKAILLEPEYDRELDVVPSSLVIGAGVSGMTAALDLADQGFTVHLIEKEEHLGGMARRLHAILPTGTGADEILTPMIDRVRNHEKIQLFTSAEVTEVTGFLGHFQATIESNENCILTEVGTIIVATGADVLTPEGYYEYGGDPRIITQMELEEKLLDPEFTPPNKVTMIQCVGAMEENGREYCSRICCGTALKNSLELKKLNQDTEVRILYRELQAHGVDREKIYSEALEKEVKFYHYSPHNPPEVMMGDSFGVKVFDELWRKDRVLDSDLIVLSTPLIAREGNRNISKMLRVPIDSNEFFLEAHPKMRPMDFSSDGIYLCGTAHAPKDISESISQGHAAASRASIPMRQGTVKIDAIVATVDYETCIGCGACASVCPFDAIEWNSFGKPNVIEAACKGCGACIVECPVSAMQLRYFRDTQLTDAVKGLMSKTPDTDPDTPEVLVFACRWCSYAAADFAGVMRLKYPTNVKILLVPCSGRVDFKHIYEGFEGGADGVIVTGCLKDQCHYVDGNIIAERRVDIAKKSLEVLGIQKERLEMFFCSAGMPREFAGYMKEFTERISEMGKVPRRHDEQLGQVLELQVEDD
jgi:heterodisulfide reductase subunit A